RHTRFSRDWSSDVCSSDLTISFIVVINGPLATAGSMPILFINNGISDTIVVPTVIAVVKLIPTIVANNGWPYSITMIENSIRLRSEERRVGKEWRTEWGQA